MSSHFSHRRAHRRAADLKARYEPTGVFDTVADEEPAETTTSETPTPTKNPLDDVLSITTKKETTTPAAPVTPTTQAPVVPTTSATTPAAPPAQETTTAIANTNVPVQNTVNTVPSPTLNRNTAVLTPSTTIRSTATFTQSLTSSSSSAAASATATAEASSSNIGGIVGGVGGGIVGVAILFAFIAFFLRRYRRNKEEREASEFNDTDPYGRSAIALPDTPTHQDTVNAGYNSGPAMAERRSAFGAGFGSYGAGGAGGATGGYSDYGSGSPHGNSFPAYSDNYGANAQSPNQYGHGHAPPASANPFFNGEEYNQAQQNPFSPISSPATAVLATPATFTRSSNSTGYSQQDHIDPNAQYAQYPSPSTTPAPMLNAEARRSVPQPNSDYMDLSRSSVTPFQAAQYVEISRTLHSDVPNGLDTPAVDQHLMRVPHQEVSAFSPITPDSPSAMPFGSHGHYDVVPPSPVMARNPRVDSTPPMLPEIRVQSSALPGTPSPMSAGFPSGAQTLVVGSGASGSEHGFPTTPSPMGSSFALPSPPVQRSQFNGESAPAAPAAKRPDTIYDDDDAYAGI